MGNFWFLSIFLVCLLFVIVLYAESRSLWGYFSISHGTIAASKEGFVRLEGALRPVEDAAGKLTPVSLRICVFWKIKIQKRIYYNGKNRWLTVNEFCSEPHFMKLDDGTGTCYVMPCEAELDIATEVVEISHDNLKMLSKKYMNINPMHYVSSMKIRVIEEYVPIDEVIGCYGFLRRQGFNEMPKFPLAIQKLENYRQHGLALDTYWKKFENEKDIIETQWKKYMRYEEEKDVNIQGYRNVYVLGNRTEHGSNRVLISAKKTGEISAIRNKKIMGFLLFFFGSLVLAYVFFSKGWLLY